MLHIALLIAEIAFVATVILGLFHLRRRIGLPVLFIVLGANQYLQGVLASTLYVPVLDWYVSPGSTVLFSANLFAILLVYLHEDIPQTRVLLFGIIVANLTLTVLAALTALQLGMTGTVNAMQIPVELFTLRPRVFIFGTLTLVVDVLLLIGLYESLLRVAMMPQSMRIVVTIWGVLAFDTVMFVTGSFAGTPAYTSILLSGLVGKSIAAVVYAAILLVYMRWDRGWRGPVRDSAPRHGMFRLLTYRSRLAQMEEETFRQTLLATVNDAASAPEGAAAAARAMAERFGWSSSVTWMLENDGRWKLATELSSVAGSLRLDSDVLRERLESELPAAGDPFSSTYRAASQWLSLRSGEGKALTVLLLPVGSGGELSAMFAFVDAHQREDARLERTMLEVANRVGGTLQRRKNESRLAERERSFRLLFQHSLSGIIVADVQGRIDSVNPAAAAMFGWSEAELRGRSVLELLADPPTHGPAFLREVAQRTMNQVTEWTARRRDGSTFPLELVLFGYDSAEGPMIAGHLLDITERKEADSIRKHFVSTVSHELRTPLTAIQGSLGLVAAGVLGDVPAEAQRAIEIANRNSVRLIGLINDILDYDKLSAGGFELEMTSTTTEEIVRKAVEAVEGYAQKRNVSLAIALEPVTFVSDSGRVVQVLVNLLSNAIKFSPEGGEVEVRAGASDGEVRFDVVDHGPGIPFAAQSRLFQPFQQVAAGDDARREGTGLGLSICRSIVEAHDGTIGVESKPGKGSRFWVRLPTVVSGVQRDR